jgi:hypothetical protein
MSKFACRLILPLLLVVPGLAASQGFTWPSASPPCNSTLQACVDGALVGGAIDIDSDAPTSIVAPGQTELVIGKALALRAAPGRVPRFPAGIGIHVNFTSAYDVDVEGLVLGGGAGLQATATNASGTARLGVRRMRFEHRGVAGFGVEATQNGTGTLELDIDDNRYLRTGGAGNFFFAVAEAGRISGRVRYNRVDVPDGGSSAYGIAAIAAANGTFDLSIHANQIRGAFVVGAICGISGHETPVKLTTPRLRAASNVVVGAPRRSGVGVCAYSGTVPIEAEVSNNTLLQLGLGMVFGPRPFSTPPAPEPVTGYFANNLVAYNTTGATRFAVAAGVSNSHNLFFGNGSNGTGFTAGTGTLFTNPLLTSQEVPYLGAGSPAIDAGTPDAVPAPAVLPRLDADGHRRSKGSTVDIGAFESGDAWFPAVAQAGSINNNWFPLVHPSTFGNSFARVFATPNFGLAGVENNRPHGVWWIGASTLMSIFNQDETPMPVGAGYNVLVPAPVTPLGTGPARDANVFVVRAAGSTSSVQLDDSSTNDRRDAVIVLTQNWNPQDPPASAGVYNNHTPTLRIFADLRWRIANASDALLPAGAAFNVHAQPPSPSAFVVDVGGRSGTVPFTHPLLDDAPCAVIQATPVFADANARWDLSYSNALGRWTIFRAAPGPWGSNTRFNLLFSPRQVFECAGPLFRDGFEP